MADPALWLDPHLQILHETQSVKESYANKKETLVSSQEHKVSADEDAKSLTVKEALFVCGNPYGEAIYWMLSVITAGAFLILVRWFPKLEATIRYRRSNIADIETDYVFCTALDDQVTKCTIQSIDPRTKEAEWVPMKIIRSQFDAMKSDLKYSESDANHSSFHLSGKSLAQYAFPLPRSFVWRSERFWYDPQSMTYVRRYFDMRKSHEEIHRFAAKEAAISSGLYADLLNIPFPVGSFAFSDAVELRQYVRMLSYGANMIYIKSKSFIVLYGDEAAKPFFIFQMFGMIVWLLQAYYLFAIMIFILANTSALNDAYTNMKNIEILQKISRMDMPVTIPVLSNEQPTSQQEMRHKRDTSSSAHHHGHHHRPWSPVPTFRRHTVSSHTLLPGDLVEIIGDMTLPCDILLLSGSVVVNESMLTGESAPVQKSSLPYGYSSRNALPSAAFNPKSDKDGKYILFAGTKVVQVKPQGAVNCPPLISDMSAVNKPNNKIAPETIWQFSMEQSVDSLRRYLESTDASESEIESRIQELVSSFRNREKSLPAIGIVIRTGFHTAKGQLVRSILYPKPPIFRFEIQVLQFMIFLLILLVVGWAITIYEAVKDDESTWSIILNCMDLTTVAISPALPLALSIAISAAFHQLKRKKIYCIDPNRIVAGGRVNVLCFDKTGTLTEDGLTLKGVQYLETLPESESIQISAVDSEVMELYFEKHKAMYRGKSDTNDPVLLSNMALCYTLASCHSLSLLEDDESDDEPGYIPVDKQSSSVPTSHYNSMKETKDFVSVNVKSTLNKSGKLFVGDPLEIQMFTNTHWKFLARRHKSDETIESKIWSSPHLPSFVDTIIYPPAPSKNSHALAIIKRFDFDSDIRRMATLVSHIPIFPKGPWEPEYILLVKGAPENIRDICTPESIPDDFESNMQKLALSGYRILACAYKSIKIDSSKKESSEGKPKSTSPNETLETILSESRAEMEKDMMFSGFLVMENALKEETLGALEKYVRAGLRCIMVTGDNPHTAFAVSRKCDPFFVRPSRRTFLLDVQSQNRIKPTLTIEDVFDPSVRCDFQFFLRSKSIPTEMLLMDETPADLKSPHPVFKVKPSENGENVDESLRKIDLVVTGSAFSYLQAEHSMLIKKKGQGRRLFQGTDSSTSTMWKKLFRTRETDPIDKLSMTPFQVVLTRANIFARMTPKNKEDLMHGLQDLHFAVCMTGDGANDSGALKSADIGLSIQAKKVEADDVASDESSLSVAAPFSTPIHHIGAVSELILEGRCCIVSTFAIFRFMFCYGMIQAMSVIILYKNVLEFSDLQYLWGDLALVFPAAILMPLIKARKTLMRGRPEPDLISTTILRSVVGFIIFIVGFQIAANEYLHHTSRYEEPDDDTNESFNADSTESFLFSNFQFPSVGIALSQSFGVFRQPLDQNYILVFVFILEWFSCSLMLVSPSEWIKDKFDLVNLKNSTRWILWIMAVVNFFCFILYERYFVPHQSLDEDPIDVDQVLSEMDSEQRAPLLKEKPKRSAHASDSGYLKKPNYAVAREITSPVWTALSHSK